MENPQPRTPKAFGGTFSGVKLHRLRRFRFEVGMMLGGKTNASANKDRFISPDVAKPMSNLPNLCNLRILSSDFVINA
jgi:hypothetical protein